MQTDIFIPMGRNENLNCANRIDRSFFIRADKKSTARLAVISGTRFIQLKAFHDST